MMRTTGYPRCGHLSARDRMPTSGRPRIRTLAHSNLVYSVSRDEKRPFEPSPFTLKNIIVAARLGRCAVSSID